MEDGLEEAAVEDGPEVAAAAAESTCTKSLYRMCPSERAMAFP